MASLGEKLQKVHSKVNTKLGVQDAPLTFYRITQGAKAAPGKPYVNPVTTSLVIDKGVKLSWVKAYQADGEVLNVGDAIFTIPANLIDKTWLEPQNERERIDLSYQGVKWSLIKAEPKEVYGGTVVQWVVYARKVG